jgi:hypothetical protein
VRSVQQQRERAVLWRLAEATSDPALREQLEIAAADYDAIADEMEREGGQTPTTRPGRSTAPSVQVGRLRRNLEDDPKKPTIINT